MSAQPSRSVLSFVTAGYLPLMRLWLAQSRPCMDADPAIYALDDESLAALDATAGVEGRAADADARATGSRRKFWVRRLELIEAHAREHGSALHTDLDAFWLRPPAPELDAIDADLIVSVEAGLPREVNETRGFVLCCGFFLARWTAAAPALFEAWREGTVRYEDDQIALNLMLDREAANWRPRQGGGHLLETRVGGRAVRVATLPDTRFTRRDAFAAGEAAVVAHPFFRKRWQPELLHLYAEWMRRFGRFTPAPAPEPPQGVAGKSRDWAALHALAALGVDPAASGDAGLLALWGALSLRAGRPADAALALGRAMEMAPPLGAGYLLDLADAAAAVGDRRTAAEALRRAAAAPERSEELTVEMAKASLRSGDVAAIAKATAAVAQLAADPALVGAWVSRQRILRRRRRGIAAST